MPRTSFSISRGLIPGERSLLMTQVPHIPTSCLTILSTKLATGGTDADMTCVVLWTGTQTTVASMPTIPCHGDMIPVVNCVKEDGVHV